MNQKLIYGILILAVIVRLYHVDFPVAGFQAWRQADTAAMARNFYENGFRIMYPQIDWGGNSPGYVETEFPLFQFLAACLYYLFAPTDAIGRIVAIAFSIVTIYVLYLLAKRYLGERVGLWTAFVYAILPLNIYYSRAYMPESMMLMSSVLGIYFYSQWCDHEKSLDICLSGFFVALAALLKLPALYLGLPILFLSREKYGWALFSKAVLWIYAMAILLPVALWYYHAHTIFLSSGLSFGIWDAGHGKWGNVAPLFTIKFYNDVIFKSIAERHLTYAGFILFVMGLFVPRKNRNEKVFDWWLLAIVIYFIIVTTGNQVHEYYQLPFTIPAAVFIGKTLSLFTPREAYRQATGGRKTAFRIAYLCLLVLPILSFLRYDNFMKGEQSDSPLFQLEDTVKQTTKPTDLIVAVDEGDPLILYRCDRKGWHSSPGQLNDELLKKLAHDGAGYLVGLKSFFEEESQIHQLDDILKRYEVVKQTPEYFIVKLRQA